MTPSAADGQACGESPRTPHASRPSTSASAARTPDASSFPNQSVSAPALFHTTRCYVSSAKEKVDGINLSYGQIIEIIPDQLYLASFTRPPNYDTPFPYISKPVVQQPVERSSRTYSTPATSISKGPAIHPPAYISIDDNLFYNPFFQDFGPLSMGQLHRLSHLIHEAVSNPQNENRAIVIWTNAESRKRANAACAIACYLTLWQDWAPHYALAPFAQMDPASMPFRDAGYSQADYTISIKDVVYGMWKAKQENLCDLKSFSLEEYELFEHVDQGDFNWLTPDFLAFASPQYLQNTVIQPNTPLYDALPKNIEAVLRSKSIPLAFRNVLAHFASRDVGLIVRLNSHLYPASFFTALGIQHLDMIFDDGTCPTLSTVRKFITIAHYMITVKRKSIAVHCKAGLGRTGCLIGAYLIYRYGFTADEVIGFMRVMRPGMVVGPQQHWLHLNQGNFREWWYEDCTKEKLAAVVPATPTRQQSAGSQARTPPVVQGGSPRRSALGEIRVNDQQQNVAAGGFSVVADSVSDENLPMPTPGQPRKTGRGYKEAKAASPLRGFENVQPESTASPQTPPSAGSPRLPSYQQQQRPMSSVKAQLQAVAGSTTPEDDPMELVSPRSRQRASELDSGDELQLRAMARRSPRMSAAAREKRRAASAAAVAAAAAGTSDGGAVAAVGTMATATATARVRRTMTTATATTTMTTTTTMRAAATAAAMAGMATPDESEVETLAYAAATPVRSSMRTGAGAGWKVRASPVRRSTEGKTGVRKISGRVGSLGNGMPGVGAGVNGKAK